MAVWVGAWGLAACADPTPPIPDHVVQGEAFGTTWTVRWRGEPGPDVASEAIAAVLERVDRRMSTWRDDSELQAVRRGPGPVAVSHETASVVEAALSLARATGGAFDPTVEPLMEVWGFRGVPLTEAPTDEAIEAARAQVGWTRVSVALGGSGGSTVDAGGTALDLSAIAKGHAVDQVSWALSRLGASDHMVEIGGEVRAHGQGTRGAWRLGVDRPDAGSRPGEAIEAVLGLANAALATSGNHRNVQTIDGRRVVHTMDPRTGRPHDSALASVSVVAPDCRTADGWATALMVLGPEAGLSAVEARPELEALFLVTAPEGFEARRSSGLDDWLVDR